MQYSAVDAMFGWCCNIRIVQCFGLDAMFGCLCNNQVGNDAMVFLQCSVGYAMFNVNVLMQCWGVDAMSGCLHNVGLLM